MNVLTHSYGKELNKRSLYSVLICNKTTSIETFDGGLSYSLINTQKVNEALQGVNEKNNGQKNNTQISDIKVFPNPFIKSLTMNFNLNENAYISIYSVDNLQNKQVHFSGLKSKGPQELNIDLPTAGIGLVIIYIEVNGIVSIYKVIKM